MLALRLTVFCLLFCGSYGFVNNLFKLFNRCNPPETLVGKFCADTFDNDVYGDGVVDNRDFNFDMILYNYDDNLCELSRADVIQRWTCRFGYSENYGHFIFDTLFDGNKDGVVTYEGDFAAPVTIPKERFVMIQYNRFKDEYCSVPANRENPIDRVLCKEVDELDPADIVC